MQPWSITWLIEHRLAACAHPRTRSNLRALARLGVTVLINLHEQPHDPLLLGRAGLRELHLPVADFTAPSEEQLRQGVAVIERSLAQNGVVAVHCAGGLGRTGTLLACFFVHRGQQPLEAIARLRTARPGSVETDAQEAAVAAFAAAMSEDG